jgi:hypothetical protein
MTPVKFQQKNPIRDLELQIDISGFFGFGTLRPEPLFCFLYKKLPNEMEIDFVCVEKAHSDFLETYQSIITDSYHSRRQLNGKNEVLAFDDMFYCFGEDGMIVFNHNRNIVNIYYRDTTYSLIQEIEEFILKHLADHLDSKLGLITAGKNGFVVNEFTIKQVEANLDLNYNDDLAGIHEIILTRLLREKDKGLVLLYGEPGTGKTSYIRHLIGQVKKRVLFVSPQMAEELSAPQVISVLMENLNSILVIEDAEKILTSREDEKNSAVTTLLNLTDGLLSDCLNIQIICSFNTDISRIDSALLRKGRLIAKYNFKLLSVEKTNALARSLGLNSHFSGPTKLTDIYNDADIGFEAQETKMAIGF